MNFLSRPHSKCRLSLEFYADLQWWQDFLSVFNGQCVFFERRPITSLHTDACTYGIGAFFEGDWLYSHALDDD